MTAESIICAADDPGPLLDLAATFELRGNHTICFALRWCAGRKVRVYERTDVKRAPRFQLVRQQPKYALTRKQLADRTAAILPRLIFDAMECRDSVIAFHTPLDAYRWIGEALLRIGRLSIAPTPPARKVHGWTCSACGIERAVGVHRCEVCGGFSKTENRR